MYKILTGIGILLLQACTDVPGLYCTEKVGDYIFPVYITGYAERLAPNTPITFALFPDSNLNQSKQGSWKEFPYGISQPCFEMRIKKHRGLGIYEDFAVREYVELPPGNYLKEAEGWATIRGNSIHEPYRPVVAHLRLPQGKYRIELGDFKEISVNAVTGSAQCTEFIHCRYYWLLQPGLLGAKEMLTLTVE